MRAHSHVRLPLEIETLLPSIILDSRMRSLSGEPLQFMSGFPRKNLSHLQTKHRPLRLHVFIFTHFNQSLTINNIATATLA